MSEPKCNFIKSNTKIRQADGTDKNVFVQPIYKNRDMCYLISSDQIPYKLAEDACKNNAFHKGNLASIHDTEKMNMIIGEMESPPEVYSEFFFFALLAIAKVRSDLVNQASYRFTLLNVWFRLNHVFLSGEGQ